MNLAPRAATEHRSPAEPARGHRVVVQFGIRRSMGCVMNDAPLLDALRELGDRLSAADVPQGVIEALPRLSDCQKKLLLRCSWVVLQWGHRMAACVLSHPICFWKCSPQCAHVNGHGLSSSYMTHSPLKLSHRHPHGKPSRARDRLRCE
jgi:hypothetical protein